MSDLKFRAVICKNTVVYFTLEDLVQFPYPKFSVRELVIPWLRAGNVPDRHTPLKDKDGKEAYEGDILRDTTRGYECVAVIEFISNGFWIKENCGVYLPNEECREIIGNIHQNPEILKERL